jgi:hypothetical protein
MARRSRLFSIVALAVVALTAPTLVIISFMHSLQDGEGGGFRTRVVRGARRSGGGRGRAAVQTGGIAAGLQHSILDQEGSSTVKGSRQGARSQLAERYVAASSTQARQAPCTAGLVPAKRMPACLPLNR